VLRGGCFYNLQVFVCCAYRSKGILFIGEYGYGFRIVVRPCLDSDL